MKGNSKKAAKAAAAGVKAAHKVRNGIIVGASMFGLFAGSAATTFFTTEGKVTVIDLRDEEGGEPTLLTGKDRFISNLASSATTGLNISVTDLKLDQYYVDSEGNEDTSKGHNTITNGKTTSGESAPISIALKMDELSLHGINLALTAPIAYSNNGSNAKYRGVHASLLPYAFDGENDEQTLFVNLFDNGNDVFSEDEDGNTVVSQSSGGSWNFKYRVGVDSKDSTYFDSEANVTDATTRGTEYYEYGELDWFLADILDILSEGAISVDFGDMINDLFSKETTNNANANTQAAATETTGGDSSNEETSDSTPSGISIDDIMASMGEMQDVGTEEAPYFVWELPLGDKTLVLGMGGDSEYNLSSVDLPAKAVKGEDGTYTLSTSSVDPWKIQDGLTLSAHADINGNLPSSWASQVYGNVSDYKKLTDSAAMFKRIAKAVASPELGVDASFTIGHNEDAVEGSRTVLRKDAVSEALKIDLSAGLDLYDDANKAYALEGIDVDLKIDQVRESTDFKGHEIQVAYLKEDADAEVSAYNAYVNVNDVLLAKTSKTYLDELITDVKESTFFSSSSEDNQSDGVSLDSFLDLLGDDINAILDSDLVNGIKSGSYTAIADLISSIEANDNNITVTLSLAPLGLNGGTISLVIDGATDDNGNYTNSLVELSIANVNFGNFSLNGTLEVDGLSREVKALTAPEGKAFESLSHVRGIFGTVEKIADSKSFSASISGAAYKEDGTTKSMEIVDSGLAFNFNEGKTSGKVNVELDTYGDVNQQHNIKLGLDNMDVVSLDENNNEVTTNDKVIGFSYDSKSTKENFVSQSSDKAVSGRVGLNSAKTALDNIDLGNLLSFFSDDDRFSRLSSALLKEESGSLLSDLMSGKYFGLFEKQGLISSLSLGSTTDLTIDASKLGMEGTTIDLSLSYLANTESVDEDNNASIVEGGLDALNLVIKKDGVKSFEVKVDEIDTLEDTSTKVASFADITSLDDFTPIVDLAGELLNTLTLGYSSDENDTATQSQSETLTGVSYYGVEGSVGLELVGDEVEIYDFDAQASVEGAETKLAVNFDDLPVVRGLNGPNSDTYYRRNELLGQRDSNIYFYANGINPEGEFLLTRDSSYGKVRNVKDAVRVSGKDYTSDFLNWVLEYTIGVDESLLEEDSENTSTSTETTAETTSEAAWNPFANGIHIADCWNGFSVDTAAANKTTYTLGLDLGELLGIGILGDANVKLVSNDLKCGNVSARCLSEVHVSAGVDVTSTSDTTMHIASVSVDLALTNLGDVDDNGYSLVDPVLGEGSNYYSLFVGTVDDNGKMDSQNTVLGELYSLKDGFQSDDVNNAYYNLYGYNLIGKENVVAGNYYLGID
ncbi:MAG: hypothetical protein K6B65_03210 [Bacilli bacterium]|nr:hypothetical protein [Bacilli bacterium]